MKILWQLFLTFFRIGAFTFGGGYAMIPLIQREVVENKKWITDDDILEIIAIAESTPVRRSISLKNAPLPKKRARRSELQRSQNVLSLLSVA